MLVGQKVIPEPLNRHTPFLTDEPEIVLFQDRLNLVEALLHFSTIREKRQHRTMLGKVRLHQELLKALEILGLLRLGHVVDYVYRHVPIEIVRGIEGKRCTMRGFALIQPHRRLEQ